ncbi:MAG: DUF4266 domain-containing protein [Granulosicoccus sp.]
MSLKTITLAACLLTSNVLAGCSVMGVQPWDRDLLAQRQMQIGEDALDLATDDHIYFSKEATSGGRGFGGGGCGCN